jgi:hypothetical protein
VDHFEPKSNDWRLVYEWSNYRLCSAAINGHRSDRAVAHDPFAIEPGLFALEFVAFQVIPRSSARGALAAQVEDTIGVLGLNRRACCKAREEYVEDYRRGPPHGTSLPRLEARAPFVARSCVGSAC